MIAPDKLFENYFDDIRITTTRLNAFGSDCLNKLIAANGAGTTYSTLIALLQPAIAATGAELGDVDTGLALQKGKTGTVDSVIDSFKATMSTKEGVIADLFGGKNTPGYIQFYPHGVSEYRNATKTSLPTLLNRVYTAATTNAVTLGATLATLLQSFEENYTEARNSQQQQMGSVSTDRSQRTDARTNLETALVTTVHTIAAMFPGNVQQCQAFFDFSLLFALSIPKHETLSGPIATAATIQVLNRTLTNSSSITAINTDDNAPFLVYLSATATGTPGPKAKEVAPGQSLVVKPADLGDLANTFLLIKNISAVNEGSYQLTLTGPAANGSPSAQ